VVTERFLFENPTLSLPGPLRPAPQTIVLRSYLRVLLAVIIAFNQEVVLLRRSEYVNIAHPTFRMIYQLKQYLLKMLAYFAYILFLE
jgi:hypothetical protein